MVKQRSTVQRLSAGKKVVSSKRKEEKDFTGRAAIEPEIGHLKANYRSPRNFYTGIKQTLYNVMLAAAAMDFKK